MIFVAAKVLAKRDHRYLPYGFPAFSCLGCRKTRFCPPYLHGWSRGAVAVLDARRSRGDVVSPATGVR